MVEVCVVGFGTPGRSMAWYHAKQVLEGRVPGAKLTSIVSPSGCGCAKMLEETWPAIKDGKCKLYHTVAELAKDQTIKSNSVAVVACRTSDMPQRVNDAMDHGFKFIYLEKPGAPTLPELEKMSQYADAKGVHVFMGYNKNVASYVTKARQAQETYPGSQILLEHNNPYKTEELDSCFEINSEGMLKNMAIHELMLAITFFGVTVSSLKDVIVETEFSKLETRGAYTDFSHLQFTLTTHDGNCVGVKADRCGGNNSRAIVSKGGKKLFTSEMPDAEAARKLPALVSKEPTVSPNLLISDEEYLDLKHKLCVFARRGVPVPANMPTLNQGVEVLRLAEHLTPLLMARLQASKRRKLQAPKKCGIALVGAGRMGVLRSGHIFANPMAELVCIIDSYVEGAKKLAEKYDCGLYSSLQEALDADVSGKITAVWVAVPTSVKEGVINVAAAAKKPIFTEKPVAETPEEISKLFAVCKAAAVPLCCGFQRRFDTSYVAMKNTVANGDIGKIVLINVMFGDHPTPPLEYLAGASPLLDMSPHDVDFIGWLLEGEEPEEVYATASSSTQAFKDANVCDHALLVAKYGSGTTATISISLGAVYGYDNRVEVFGTKGRLVVETPAETTLTKQDLMGTHTARLQHSFPQRFFQAFGAEVDLFVRICLQEDGAQWPIDEKACVVAQKVAMTANQSNESGSVQKYKK